MAIKTLHRKPKETLAQKRQRYFERFDKLEGEGLEKEVDRHLSKLKETFKKYSRR